MNYRVAEIFLSINGEGPRAGELAAFVRLAGCNLACRWCDTRWACTEDAPAEELTEEQILETIAEYHVKNVTLTGGEPLLAPHAADLLHALSRAGFRVEIETNGSVGLALFCDIDRVSFTMDYKLPGSGMEDAMLPENFRLLGPEDSVKFVVSSRGDLLRAWEVSEEYLTDSPAQIFLSPVFGEIEPAEIVDFLKEKCWTRARLQIQLHKVIWDPAARGV